MPLRCLMTPSMDGVFHGGETAFTQLHVRLIIDSVHESKLSVGCLYMDVVAAFATMLRRIIFDHDEGDEAWLASLAKAGFNEHEIKIIYESICDHGWVEDLIEKETVSDPTSCCAMDFAMAEQLFSNSWVSQEYIPNVVNVTRGSSAGTPLADFLYSMCMSRAICRYRKAISDAGLSSVVCAGDETFPVNDVSFVDDMAQLVVDVASTICQKIGKIANVAYAVFRMFGMLLNSLPGKSEATVSFRGTDSKKAAKIFVPG